MKLEKFDMQKCCGCVYTKDGRLLLSLSSLILQFGPILEVKTNNHRTTLISGSTEGFLSFPLLVRACRVFDSDLDTEIHRLINVYRSRVSCNNFDDYKMEYDLYMRAKLILPEAKVKDLIIPILNRNTPSFSKIDEINLKLDIYQRKAHIKKFTSPVDYERFDSYEFNRIKARMSGVGHKDKDLSPVKMVFQPVAEQLLLEVGHWDGDVFKFFHVHTENYLTFTLILQDYPPNLTNEKPFGVEIEPLP